MRIYQHIQRFMRVFKKLDFAKIVYESCTCHRFIFSRIIFFMMPCLLSCASNQDNMSASVLRFSFRVNVTLFFLSYRSCGVIFLVLIFCLYNVSKVFSISDSRLSSCSFSSSSLLLASFSSTNFTPHGEFGSKGNRYARNYYCALFPRDHRVFCAAAAAFKAAFFYVYPVR